jgi:predicted transcriptional regulator
MKKSVGIHITPNGTELTLKKLKQMLKENTLEQVAGKLGYKTIGAIKHIYQHTFGEKWIPKERHVESKTRMVEGVMVYRTPNNTIIDIDMLNAMLSQQTTKQVATALGYKSRSSVELLFKRLNGKINRRRQWMSDDEIQLMQEMHRFLLKKRYAPTFEELGEVIGLSGRTVRDKIETLIEKGYIEKNDGRGARTYHLTDDGIAEVFGEEYFTLEEKIFKTFLCETS